MRSSLQSFASLSVVRPGMVSETSEILFPDVVAGGEGLGNQHDIRAQARRAAHEGLRRGEVALHVAENAVHLANRYLHDDSLPALQAAMSVSF